MVESTRIFLTGGTGFFGRALLRNWIEQMLAGAATPSVTILTRSPGAFLNRHPEFGNLPWLNLHIGDILDPHTFPRETAFTHIAHAAADSGFGAQITPLQRFDQIVSGTRNLLDYAVACGAKRFLFTSSGAVYGTQPPHLTHIPEDWHGMPDPLSPPHTYGVAKRAAEHLCALYADLYGLNIVIARCFAFVGRDLPLGVHFAIGNFIRDALWHSEITVSGTGTPLRSYLDQRDLAHWLLTLIERGQTKRAYNVGSDQAISIVDLAHLVRNIIAPGKQINVLSKSYGINERNLYIPSIKKAREELGLDVRVSLANAIRNAADAISTAIDTTGT